MDTASMFVYLLATMYALFHELQTTSALLNSNHWIRTAEMWILVEMVVFFG